MNSKWLFSILGVLVAISVQADEGQTSSQAQTVAESVQVKGVRCKNNETYQVHLSFDDGPKIPETLRVLDTLKKYGIKATFLVSASHFPSMAKGNPPNSSEKRFLEVIERMKKEGHTVGSHSYEHLDHGNLSKNGVDKIEENLSLNYKVFEALNLKKPIPFRFPYGGGWFASKNPANQAMHDRMIREIKEHGYRPFHWDVDTWDWSKIKRKALPESVLREICSHGGGIALMHDIHKWTADHLDAIIQSIQQSGHKLVSESEIVGYSSKNPKGPLVSLEDGAAGIGTCDRPVSDMDQVWTSCTEYQKKSSDLQQKGVN